MTPKQLKVRQNCYVISGVLSPFIGGITMLDTSDWRFVAAFFAGIILGGVNALRAFLDGSTRDVLPEPPAVEPFVANLPPLNVPKHDAKKHSELCP